MESVAKNTSDLRNNKQETLNILAYSDIFDYPLTKTEIYERGKIEIDELDHCLTDLVNKNKIFFLDGFYSLHKDERIIQKRKKRNALALDFMKKAKLMTKIIANFPFIRGIFLSGSISKNCMDEDSDIDFFIVTEPNRLWISFLFCSIFKKIIFLNNSKYFCYNFLIDSEHLSMNDKNLYTATEMKTLIPLYGYKYYQQLLKNNLWADCFFPKYPISSNKDVFKNQPCIQIFLEFLLNNYFGRWLDKWVMTKSIERRKRRLAPKFFQNPSFYINIQSHIAKLHLTDTYPNIMKKYAQKINEYSYLK